MKKMLTSKWGAAVLGMIAFTATMLVLWNPAQDAAPKGANAAVNTNTVSAAASTNEHPVAQELAPKHVVTPPQLAISQVGEAGSLKFDNPEIVQLRTELQQEKAALLERERQLNDLARRLKAEMETIGTITQQVMQAKSELEQSLLRERTVIQSSETNQLRQLARVLTNMVPDTAVSILDKMPVEEVARILHLMENKQAADILENFATNNATKTSGKATEISEKIRTLAPKPQLPTKKPH